jgi:hypothetical protein
MTRLMVMANLDAVGHLGSVSHYRHLAESLRRSGPAALTQGEVNRRLAQIVTDGKELATQFNALYDEFSRVSFGSSALLYQVDQPVRAETQKPFSLRAYAMLVAATALLSFLAGLAVATVRRRMRATPVTS